MGSNEIKVRKGAWTKEEDLLLTKCIQDFGEGKWHLVPHRAGLNRCRKSCRMRWLNYLQPNVKRGYFDAAEVDLIQRLHKLLGNRWSLIAGRIPGRTANDVKNFWNTHISKKNPSSKKPTAAATVVIKPRPRHLTALASMAHPIPSNESTPSSSLPPVLLQEEDQDRDCGRGRELEHERWWREVLRMSENGEGGSFEDLLTVGPPEYEGGERVDVDGLMSDLLVDFHAWENI